MIAKVLLYCNENIGKCTRSTRSHDAPLNQSENAPLQRRASKKMIFYSTLSGWPTNFISFYTTASRCPRSSYTGYLGRSKALCLQGNWFCAPITHKKRNAPPHICLCILFFWYALHKNVANRSLSILCVFKYPWTPKLLRHAVTVTGTVDFVF